MKRKKENSHQNTLFSEPHGHIHAVVTALPRLISSRSGKEKDLLLPMIVTQILRHSSKLAMTSWWEEYPPQSDPSAMGKKADAKEFRRLFSHQFPSLTRKPFTDHDEHLPVFRSMTPFSPKQQKIRNLLSKTFKEEKKFLSFIFG